MNEQQGPLQNPSLIGKQGNLSQLGGEFVFVDGTCTFVNRMKNTEDRESRLLFARFHVLITNGILQMHPLRNS
jgi:hypothetical protein